jgi:hypothetical protein
MVKHLREFGRRAASRDRLMPGVPTLLTVAMMIVMAGITLTMIVVMPMVVRR